MNAEVCIGGYVDTPRGAMDLIELLFMATHVPRQVRMHYALYLALCATSKSPTACASKIQEDGGRQSSLDTESDQRRTEGRGVLPPIREDSEIKGKFSQSAEPGSALLCLPQPHWNFIIVRGVHRCIGEDPGRQLFSRDQPYPGDVRRTLVS